MGKDIAKQALAYIVSHYPYPSDLSKARLTKLLYLADWRMAIQSGRQITDVQWYYNHYGPYVREVEDMIRASDEFELSPGVTPFGNSKETVQLLGVMDWPDLTPDQIAAIDHVIDQTKNLNFTGFLNLVYSTYPVRKTIKYSYLDLSDLAREYRATESGRSL